MSINAVYLKVSVRTGWWLGCSINLGVKFAIGRPGRWRSREISDGPGTTTALCWGQWFGPGWLGRSLFPTHAVRAVGVRVTGLGDARAQGVVSLAGPISFFSDIFRTVAGRGCTRNIVNWMFVKNQNEVENLP